jgi:NADH-quinone oxidoreductase subunit G
MPKIIIDGQEIECREGISALQAALEAGWDVPHYCYHPSLKVVASCRLCLMEMKLPHPKTKELGWSPKLVPSCQTPVKDGMEVRFHSDRVQDNQRDCMEFFLLNHPLDCPVCDQAGECYLQDYSEEFGNATSRMVEQKQVNPKKDIGPKTLLYSDRCVMCSRCVRFTQEISGTHELSVVNRGARAEIDVYPGMPLDNPLQGNVVDICPVGALLDKDFLFKRRVWELRGTPSVCAGCARGCTIRVDHADQQVYRLKPRFNPAVNDYWMCDEGRFGFKYVQDEQRLRRVVIRRAGDEQTPEPTALPEILRTRFEEHIRARGGASIAAIFSPFLSCEEAWLLMRFLRDRAPASTLVMGPVPLEGEDQHFPVGATRDDVQFTISKEKCPNRRGLEMLFEAAGGNVLTIEQFVEQANKGEFKALWSAGGYPKEWVSKDLAKLAGKFELLVAQDLYPNALTEAATILLPSGAWVEREGCFVNADGLIQPFVRAINPPEGVPREGQYLFELVGYEGLFTGRRVRELMAEKMPAFANLHEPPPRPAHQH